MLHDYELVPGFEMMGNPSDYFTDLEDHSQILLFADLAFQIASRYISLFRCCYLYQFNSKTCFLSYVLLNCAT